MVLKSCIISGPGIVLKFQLENIQVRILNFCLSVKFQYAPAYLHIGNCNAADWQTGLTMIRLFHKRPSALCERCLHFHVLHFCPNAN